MIEAWGRGTVKIVDECKKAGLPEPEFREEFGGFSVFFRKADKVTNKAQVEAQEAQVETKPKQSGEQTRRQPESLNILVVRRLSQAPLSKAELSASLGHKEISGQLNKIIRELLQNKIIEYTIPDKPQSRLQKYRLTAKGRRILARVQGDKK